MVLNCCVAFLFCNKSKPKWQTIAIVHAACAYTVQSVRTAIVVMSVIIAQIAYTAVNVLFAPTVPTACIAIIVSTLICVVFV